MNSGLFIYYIIIGLVYNNWCKFTEQPDKRYSYFPYHKRLGRSSLSRHPDTGARRKPKEEYTLSVKRKWFVLWKPIKHIKKKKKKKKKNITSLECRPLKSNASTSIIFWHRLGKVILNKHIRKKQKFTPIIEEINVMKSQEVNFQNHRNCLPLGLGVRSRQKPLRRLRNPPLKLNE